MLKLSPTYIGMGQENVISLWRMCRVVSTERRLKLLWVLFENGELCVRDLAERTLMQEPIASVQLKILYSCGLIRFRRAKNRVYYRAEANGRVKGAGDLLAALKDSCDRKETFPALIRQVTGFTHERRIEIVQALRSGARSFQQLQDGCRMTSSALSRHLLKLEARGFVRGDGALYYVEEPPGRVGGVLVKIICTNFVAA